MLFIKILILGAVISTMLKIIDIQITHNVFNILYIGLLGGYALRVAVENKAWFK